MLKLYYAPDNASLVLRLAMEEIGIPYETLLVDRACQEQKSREYLALNPVGQIPTLVTPQGPMSETGACLLWLCDAHPDANLCPAIRDKDRGTFLRWLFYLSNTVHTDLIRIFYPERFVPAEAMVGHYELLTEQLKSHFQILENASQDSKRLFVAGTALSVYLCPLMRWSSLYPVSGKRWFDLGNYPSLSEVARELEERATVKRAVKAEGLGATPFSDPQLPIPPEGSAT